MRATFWKGKRVLVTGAGGFVGSHLAERLVALEARTRAFVHYRASNAWGWLEQSSVKADMDVLAGDIRDRDSVLQAMDKVDVVFHLAALIGIPYSYHAPVSYVQTNVEGTLNVLQAARAQGVQRVIHTSTSEVYGTARYVPMDEQHPLQAQSPYAASKIAADKLAEAFFLSFKLPVVTVRPFNVFGPRQSARAVIPTIISQGLTDGRVQLGNTSPMRDLNYVENVVDGFLRAAEVPEAVGRTINVGSGREVSIEALVTMIAGVLGKSIQLDRAVDRMRPIASEVERLLADHATARTLLGWEPLISLEEGLRITIEWMREHLDAYRPGVYVI